MSDKQTAALPTASEIELATAIGFRKPDLSKHKVYRAGRVRYPYYDDEKGTYRITFNAEIGSGNKPTTRECTREVYSRVYGRHPGGDINKLPVGGLSMQAERRYWVYENKDTHVIEAITVGPAQLFGSRQNAPEVLQNRQTMELVYHAEGSFEVTFDNDASTGVLLPLVPGDFKPSELERIVNASARADKLQPGSQLGDFRVTAVAGNRVTLSR